jgi:hypothetical protein
MNEKKCSLCRYWTPTYHGVGTCEREGKANAKFWVTEGKSLLTVASFGCTEHEAQPEVSKETL